MNNIIKFIQDSALQQLRDLLERSHNQVNETDADGITPLAWAVTLGYLDEVQLLLEHGANPDFKDNDGESPLHVAAFNGDANIVRVLLDMGAAVDAQATDGKTPLMCASQSGSADCVELLLSGGANVALQDDAGRTCLHWACTGSSDESLVRRLITAGANPRSNTKSGHSAKDYATVLLKKDIQKLF